jgi:hypothetical protein
MSEPENFLSRWSRRKLEGEQETQRGDESAQPREPNASARPRASGDPEPHPHNETADSAALDSRLRGNERSGGVDDNKEPAFDLTKLPSLESITSETDIRLFLQKGVPAHLTRAALRRAWTADPAIRDFKEMAENQYDFATGSDLPGFGSLDASADDIRKMVANVFGDGPKTLVEQQATTLPEGETLAKTGSPEVARPSAEPTPLEDIAAAPQDQRPPEAAPAEPVKDIVHRNKVTVAAQQSNTEVEYDPMPSRRPHGRALPQ